MDKIDLILIFAVALGIILVVVGLLLGIFVMSKSISAPAPKTVQNLPYQYWPYFLLVGVIAIIVILLFKQFVLK